MWAGDPDVIDLSVLARYLRYDAQKMREHVRLFLEDTRKTMTEMEAALAHADMDTVTALAHRTKSSAGLAGAGGVAELCRSLEKMKGRDDIACARDIVRQLQSLVERITQEIENRLAAQEVSASQSGMS